MELSSYELHIDMTSAFATIDRETVLNVLQDAGLILPYMAAPLVTAL